MNDTKTQKHAEEELSEDKDVMCSRRQTLKRLGKYGAYTAPAMVALLTSQKTVGGVMT